MPMDFWSPSRLERDAPFLRYRQMVKQQIGDFFTKHDFIEVETPALQISPGMEPHIAAFKTLLMPAGQGFADTQIGVLNRPDPMTLYLHTSPEFAMKKLLAGGLEKIWQITKCYRNGEDTKLHHPEFTMLEWYRANLDDDPLLAADMAVQDLKLDLM